jgi:hypothetical protein
MFLARDTRMHHLVDVKRPLAKSFDGAGIPDPQHEQRNKKKEANNPSNPEVLHPFWRSDQGCGSSRP